MKSHNLPRQYYLMKKFLMKMKKKKKFKQWSKLLIERLMKATNLQFLKRF